MRERTITGRVLGRSGSSRRDRGFADDRAQLRRFHLLVAGAVGATYLLILVGGVVRVSDSGLGCGKAGSGTHGWPLCGGRLVPLVESKMIVEYTHRFLAALVTALLVAIAWQAARHLRERRWLVRGSIAGVALIVVQAVLGGLTVERDLEVALVAVHLGTAMLLLGLLLALEWAARPPAALAPPPPPSRRVRGLALGSAALVFATIVAGGVVAGTEKHGTRAVEEGAHMACGNEFPTCNGGFLPFGGDDMVDIQLVHRTLMFLAVFAVIGFVAVAMRRRLAGRWPAAVLTLLVVQVLLGGLNVWIGEHAWLVVAHLGAGTLLWASMVAAALRVRSATGTRAVGPA